MNNNESAGGRIDFLIETLERLIGNMLRADAGGLPRFPELNEWVSEDLLIACTGLKTGTIARARKGSWLLGREYIHVATDGKPKPTSECMYNRKAVDAWVDAQKKKQPDVKKK